MLYNRIASSFAKLTRVLLLFAIVSSETVIKASVFVVGQDFLSNFFATEACSTVQ